MAEMLIVVAIILVLIGVVAAGLLGHQKSLTRLERNTTAKEIFVAAQNHLTMADSQGYPGIEPDTGFGTQDEGAYYFLYDTADYSGDTALDLMLPFGAIDETVRIGGRYLIRYRTNPARVLDVFYWTDNGRYGGDVSYDQLKSFFGVEEGTAIDVGKVVVGHYGYEENIPVGERLENPSIEVENAERLLVRVTDTNAGAANLKVIITGVDSGAMAAIPIAPSSTTNTFRCKGSNADGVYVVTLDDITTKFESLYTDGLHFADLTPSDGVSSPNDVDTNDKLFWPGENITVKAVAYINNALTNIAYSNEWTTNSLFADMIDAGEDGETDDATSTEPADKIVMIANMRHLENLDKRVSVLDTDHYTVVEARQIADLVWAESEPMADSTAFTYRIATAKTQDDSIHPVKAEEVKVYTQGYEGKGTADGCFLPVNLDYALVYEGSEKKLSEDSGAGADISEDETEAVVCHSISGVKVDYNGVAGLFGEVKKGETGLPLTVQNLKLIDFDIKGAGHAGALAGRLEGEKEKYASVKNVVAYNTQTFDRNEDVPPKIKITVVSTDGNAGGLIGYMAYTDLERCAAALVVNGANHAGGLVGQAGGGTVTSCYAGGHTDAGEYYSHDSTTGKRTDAMYNVTAGECAGGLIGDAGAAIIRYSYSTCSVTGATAGGFVGVGVVSGKIEKCYATGLVCGTNDDENDDETGEGAFAGSYTGTIIDGQYFEIINERPIQEKIEISGSTEKKTVGFDYLKPVGNLETVDGVTPFDVAPTMGESSTERTYPYDEFVGDPNNWREAKVYDEALKRWYLRIDDGAAVDDDDGNPIVDYVLGTLEQLTPPPDSEESEPADPESNPSAEEEEIPNLVAIHYGDWPAPEWFVINAKG